MRDKTPDELVATRDGASELVPARRLARLAARTCLVGCGVLVAIPVGLIVFGFVWQWRLNRNPDPFPWRPAREWTLPNGVPRAVDFCEEDGSLIILCDEGRRSVAGTHVVRFDVETGRILSEHALPFPATAMAVSSHSDSVLIAQVPPAPHDGIPRRSGERRPLRRHVLQMATLRLPDWAVEAEVEEEIKCTRSSYELAAPIRVVAMPSRRAWVIAIPDFEQGTYRLSLRDQKTLTELQSQTVPFGGPTLGTALGPEDRSTVLMGSGEYASSRWLLWQPETDEVTFSEVKDRSTLRVKPQRRAGSARWDIFCPQPFHPPHLPDGMVLSSCLAHSTYGPPMLSAVSRESTFVASAMIVQTMASMPVPLPPIRTYLAIWNAESGKLLAAGILQGEANMIRTLWFSNDNRFLVTGHNDGTIRLWKLAGSRRDVPGKDGSAESSTPAPRSDRFTDESALASSDETLPAVEVSTPPMAVAPLDAETARPRTNGGTLLPEQDRSDSDDFAGSCLCRISLPNRFGSRGGNHGARGGQETGLKRCE